MAPIERNEMNLIVVRSHKSNYPNPIRLEPGDPVSLGRQDDRYPGWIWVTDPSGRQGWAPESILQIGTDGTAVAASAYTARELDTKPGERLTGTRELAGWVWVENDRGDSGWIPMDTVRADPPK